MPINFLDFSRLCIGVLLFYSLPVEAKKFKEHLKDFSNHILGAWVDSDECTYEEVLEALPYAELVLAHTNHEVNQIVPEGYRLLDEQEFPESLQGYFHHQELLPSGACLNEDFDACVLDPFEIVESRTLQGLGLKARVYESPDESELIVVFSGSEADLEKRPFQTVFNWMTNIGQGLGHCSLAYALAVDWVEAIKNEYPQHEVICAGISLGGGLSQYAAACLGLRAYCFNSPRLAGCQLESILRDDHSGRIKHYTVQFEILNLPLNFFDGEHIGSFCQIRAYDEDLNPLERHFTEHLVQSLRQHVAAKNSKRNKK